MDESKLDESRIGRKQGWTKTGWTKTGWMKMNWTKSGSTILVSRPVEICQFTSIAVQARCFFGQNFDQCTPENSLLNLVKSS